MRIALEIAVTLAVSAGLYLLLRFISRRQKRLYVRFICDLLRIIVVKAMKERSQETQGQETIASLSGE